MAGVKYIMNEVVRVMLVVQSRLAAGETGIHRFGRLPLHAATPIRKNVSAPRKSKKTGPSVEPPSPVDPVFGNAFNVPVALAVCDGSGLGTMVVVVAAVGVTAPIVDVAIGCGM